MKTLYSILIAVVFSDFSYAQWDMLSMSQTNDNIIPESTNIPICTDVYNEYGRVFNVEDYGIDNIVPFEVEVGASVWENGYVEALIYQLNYYMDDYPEGFNFDQMTDSGFTAFYVNHTGETIRDWVSLKVFDEVSEPLVRQFYVVIICSTTNSDVEWEESFIPLSSESGYIKSAYFGHPDSECNLGGDFDVNRLDAIGLGDQFGAILLTVTGYTITGGLVKLESNQLLVYPNPADDTVHIRLRDNLIIREVNITNMAGQQVYNSKLREGEEGDRIDVSSLAPGVYVVKVKDHQEVTHITRLLKK